MAEMTPEELRAAIDAANWAGSKIRSETKARTDSDVAKAVTMLRMEDKAADDAVALSNLVTFFASVGSDPQGAIDALVSSGSGLIAYLIEKVSGITVPADTVQRMLTAEMDTGTRDALGQIITTLYDETLKTDALAQEYRDRVPGPAAWSNFRQLIGASMRLQVGDMLADWGTQAIPFNLADGLKDIAERLDKAIGLEDALEEVVQVPMESVITEALKSEYNRKLRPVDYTFSEAAQLHLQGKLDRATLDKIYANLGIRDDNIDNIIALLAKDISESDVDTLYAKGAMGEEQVKDWFKSQAYQAEDIDRKAETVTKKREWDLEDSLSQAYIKAFATGMATEVEARDWLSSQRWTEREITLAFRLAQLNARSRGGLTKSEIRKALEYNLLTIDEAKEELLKDGLTLRDATIVLIEMLEDNLPAGKKPVDCEKLSDKVAIEGFAKIAAQMAGQPLLGGAQLLKYLQECLLK